MNKYRAAGVDRVIFFDGYGALVARNSRPNEIIPSRYVYWMNQTSSISDVDTAIRLGFPWIGEALLRHWSDTTTPADDPVALQIYDLCAKYRTPITIHQDSCSSSGAYLELERAMYRSRQTIFIFHGWWRDPKILNLESLILKHPNLYVELAGQLEAMGPGNQQTFLGGTPSDAFAYSNGTIREDWRSLFEKYPDRIINGFDLFTESAFAVQNITLRVNYWRNLLGQIDQQAAEKIAYKNVENLLAQRTATTIGTTAYNAFYSSATLGFETTGNIFDDSGIGFMCGHRAPVKLLFTKFDASRVNSSTGQPIFNGYQNLVTVGGRNANPTTKFYEDDRLAPLKAVVNTNGTLSILHGNTVRLNLAFASLTSSNDYFILESVNDAGHIVIIMWGITQYGTYASGIYFDGIFPTLSTLTQGWHIVRWQDLNGNCFPDYPSEFTAVASG